MPRWRGRFGQPAQKKKKQNHHISGAAFVEFWSTHKNQPGLCRGGYLRIYLYIRLIGYQLKKLTLK